MGKSFGQVDPAGFRNLRTKKVEITTDTIVLDTASILSTSFIATDVAKGSKLDTSQYFLNWAQGFFVVRDSSLLGKDIQFVYRVFPYKLEFTSYHKSLDRIVPYNADSSYFNPYYYEPYAKTDGEVIEWGQLNYSGSFARGVSFGSSQSLSINSELDLQLTGFIGKDVEITAALSDNNIPIQPDGNTAQVQDFDKVFIKIRKGEHEAIAGDYEIEEEESYFMKYYKQLQGASYQGKFNIMKDLSLESSVSFSIAKGQFTRNTFNGKEGNQGPYRLVGSNGETFIVVLAGSEKVFVDNELLKRGEDYDYVMDYNAGEIIFTTNYLITKDSRIVVEFEYADRSYFRTFIQTRHTLEYKKLKTWFKFYNEQDNKNNPINVSLDDEERALLRSIGDNLEEAFISGANEVEFTTERVLYKLIDTIANGTVYDSIFVYSTNADSAFYSLNFTYVGPGNGFYEPGISSANGRVFKWVAPDLNGNLTGSYEPKILLVTPKKRQLMTLGMQYDLNDQWSFTTEGAMSNNDINTLSELDGDDNRDFAAQATLSHKSKIGKKEAWQEQSHFGYEFKGTDFAGIEAYRPVEFQRDWNLGVADSLVPEHFIYGDTRFSNKMFNLSYRFSNFNRQNVYLGFTNNLGISIQKKGWRFSTQSSILTSEDLVQKSVFMRPNFQLEKDFQFWKGLTIGIKGNQENNRIRSLGTDTLTAGSFVNNTLGAFITSSDTSKVKWGINYDRRVDKFVKQNDFQTATVANTIQVLGDVKSFKTQDLKWQVTYRNLLVRDSVLSAEEPANNVLGRLEYGFNVKRGAIRYNVKYELGSGQERQRDFTYLRVQNGEGIYSWIDQNGDGLQQQNEFVISEFSDSASFVRVFTNFNEFVQTNTTRLEQSLTLNPKIAWVREDGIKGFIARFSTQSSLLISKRSLKDAKGQGFNPFSLSSDKEDIVVVNATIRNAVYFNRSSSVYKINYIQNWSQNKVLLLNGIDARQIASHQIETKWNVKTFLALILNGKLENKVFNSQFFDSDDFNIRKYEVENGVEYTFKTKLRTGIRYNYSQRKNLPEFGGELAKVHELGWDFKFSLVGKSTVTADFRYVNISYNGDSNSTKTYEILNGLKAGQNYLWNVRFEQKLARNIQLSLQYEGRKTGTNQLINTGRASVRALF
ncbi:MAG: hypothetical protein R2730_13630 [Chitinophagales bacterium]